MAAVTTLLVLTSVCVPCELWEFTSPQCPACVEMQPVIRQLHADGMPIRQIDVSRDQQTARDAGVQAIPAYLIVADGKIVARDVGLKSPQQLIELFRRGQAVTESQPAGSARPDHLTRGQAPPEASVAPVPEPTSARQQGAANVQLDLPPEINGANVRQALRSTVRLRVEDDEGISYGTGTIIDVHDNEALVLTCAHIFSSAKGNGRIYCDLFVPGATPGIEGRLISENIRRDVGLVSLRPNVKVEAVEVGGSGRRTLVSDAVYSIGCNHGEDPTVISNRVLAVNRYHGPANLVVGGRPVDGRSGGGLFDSDGTLIGVCNAADQEKDEGLYAALGPIHAELDTAGLAFIYRQRQPAVASRANPTTPAAPSRPLLQSTSPAVLPAGGTTAEALTQPSPADNRRDPNWNRLPSNAGAIPTRLASEAETEVICIVRTPGASPGSQIYVLDRPSPALVQQLSTELNRRGPHSQTSLRDTRPVPSTPQDRPGSWQSAMPTP